jgi:nickel transport system permease protein
MADIFGRLCRNRMALVCLTFIGAMLILGIFAPLFAPHDPYENDIMNKFQPPSLKYPLGTDNLGRCVFSRMVYGLRPTLFLSLVTMGGTIGLGLLILNPQENYR